MNFPRFFTTIRAGLFHRPALQSKKPVKDTSTFPATGNRVMYLLAALAAIMLLASSCIATKSEVRYLNNELVAVNKRVGELEDRMSNQITGLYQETDKIKAEIQDLTARIEDNRLLVKRIVERDTTDQDALEADVGRVKARVKRLESELQRIQSKLDMEPLPETDTGTPYTPGEAPEEDLGPRPPQKDAEAGPKESREPPEKQPSSQQQLYEKALATYKDGAHKEAIQQFEDFLEAHPKSELADNAQFWIGESFLALENYNKAIIAYEKVKENYPQGNKVPNAMLREAVAFEKINDKTSSRLLLKKIVKNYPDSREADVAKKRLGEI